MGHYSPGVVVLVAISDNFLRPFLIRKGADLPIILIITGVIGGLVAFGFIGLFIGPVVLAVTYTLLLACGSAARKGAVRLSAKNMERRADPRGVLFWSIFQPTNQPEEELR